MRFSHINNIKLIAIASIILTILGFVLDLHKSVQDVQVNLFEVLMVTAIIFSVLCTLYIFITIAFKLVLTRKPVKS